MENEEALAHVERRLQRMGVIAALERAGFKPGDDVEIGGVVFELDPELGHAGLGVTSRSEEGARIRSLDPAVLPPRLRPLAMRDRRRRSRASWHAGSLRRSRTATGRCTVSP